MEKAKKPASPPQKAPCLTNGAAPTRAGKKACAGKSLRSYYKCVKLNLNLYEKALMVRCAVRRRRKASFSTRKTTHTASSSAAAAAAGELAATPSAGREGLKRTVPGRPKRGICDLSASSHAGSWF